MSLETSENFIQNGKDLSRDAQRRSFRLFVVASMLAVIGGQVFAGNVLQLIVWNLGGQERFVGFLNFLIFGSALAQLLIIPLAQRVSKKTLVIAMLALAYAATAPMLFARSVSNHFGMTAGLALIALSVTGRQVCMSLSNPSWMGLAREFTPEKRRGRLLGTLRTTWQSVIVIMLLATGLYLGRQPAWAKLQVMIVIGLIAQLCRLLVMFGVSQPPTRQPVQAVSWLQMVTTPVRDAAYRPYLWYVMFYGIALGLHEPFRIFYLLRLQFGQNLALIASSFISLGAAATLFAWGKLADRFGNRGVFGLTLAGMVVTPLLWLFVRQTDWGLYLAMALFAAGGAFVSGNGLVQTRYLFASLKPELDAAYIAVTYLIISLAVGLGSLISSQILGLAPRLGLQVRPDGGFNVYHLTFILASLVFLMTFHFRRKFREPTETPTLEVAAELTRPLRVVFGPLLAWTRTNETKSNDDDKPTP